MDERIHQSGGFVATKRLARVASLDVAVAVLLTKPSQDSGHGAAEKAGFGAGAAARHLADSVSGMYEGCSRRAPH